MVIVVFEIQDVVDNLVGPGGIEIVDVGVAEAVVGIKLVGVEHGLRDDSFDEEYVLAALAEDDAVRANANEINIIF